MTNKTIRLNMICYNTRLNVRYASGVVGGLASMRECLCDVACALLGVCSGTDDVLFIDWQKKYPHDGWHFRYGLTQKDIY